MSSIDPAIAAAQSLMQAVDASIADATLNLGADGEAIAAQLQVGDLFPAIVLAPQAGTDLLQIFGQPVAAQLPPGIHPGETIVLQVNGFDGNRILVSNLGVVDPNNPPDLAQVVVPQPAPNAPTTVATLTTIPPPAAQAPPTAAPPLQPIAQAPQVVAVPPTAPSRAVFVAASVRPAPSPAAAPPAAEPVEIAAKQTPVASDIEARMGATRTAPSAPPQSPASPISRTVAPPSASPSVPMSIRPQQSVPLAALLTPGLKIPVARRGAAPEVAQAAPAAAAPRTAQTSQAAATGGSAQALLARLRVPQTPFALAAARVADSAVASIPRIFARLEATLPQVLPAAAIPLRALMAFVSKLDLANTRVLPEQIAAFVSHVVDGAEPKLAQVLSAYREADAPAAQATAADQSAPASAANARAMERTAALDFDLKSALVALSQSTQGASSPQLARAVSDALATTTGVQLSALWNAANDPSAITIALPAFYHDGGRPAQLRLDRDAPGGREPLDADNFRIGFVLDTASLGTLAINVETVGRTVRVDVKTERSLAAERITNTLPDLRARFEQLRYRVAAMSAGVAPPRGAVAPTAAPVDDARSAAGVDLQA